MVITNHPNHLRNPSSQCQPPTNHTNTNAKQNLLQRQAKSTHSTWIPKQPPRFRIHLESTAKYMVHRSYTLDNTQNSNKSKQTNKNTINHNSQTTHVLISISRLYTIVNQLLCPNRMHVTHTSQPRNLHHITNTTASNIKLMRNKGHSHPTKLNLTTNNKQSQHHKSSQNQTGANPSSKGNQ
eukprot:gene2901-1883_t